MPNEALGVLVYVSVAVLFWVFTALGRLVRVVRWRDGQGLAVRSFADVSESWDQVDPMFWNWDEWGKSSMAPLMGLFWPLVALFGAVWGLWWLLSRGLVGFFLLCRGSR